jgi:general secretion pathway protein D
MAAILCVVALLAPPVDGRTRKGEKLLKDGMKAEATQDYDSALTYYEQALEEDAREPAYLLATQRVRGRAAAQHITEGRKLVEQQKLNEALVQFQKALLVDPSSPVALQLVGQTSEMVKERNKAPEGTVVLTPAERNRRDIERRINTLEGPPVLRPINNQISSLKMNNQSARVIYESVGKLAGINVLFDPAGIDTLGSTTRNFNLDLNNVTLEEALAYVALVTHTFWKPISRNAIFVTQESEPKRQEYQDEVVKVFYIQNASTPNEFTEIFNGVRTGAKLTVGIFQVASQNAIIARGSTDTMAIVEKLVHDLDRPKAEVLIDVMVLEVAKSRVINLGAALTGSNILSVSPGSTSTSTGTGTTGTTTTTTTGASIPLSRLNRLSTNNFSVTLPGAIAQALMTDSRSRLLQNPQVRVTDGGKGSLKIGSKIPYVSGSLNSAVATPGSIPYATTQFQQIDVGVNIDVSPHVNGPDDISMHIKVEISSVTGSKTIAGVDQPIIGQKVNEADVRMRDGEYSLLGGLSSDTDSQSIGGLPGVSNIPVLGYLFGTRTKDKEKDDILIALVPHIIRAQAVDDQLTDGVLAGTERVVRVERKQQPATAPSPAMPPTGQPPAATPGGQPPPPLPPPGGQARMLPPTNNPRMTVTPADRQIPIVAGSPAVAAPVQAQPVQRPVAQVSDPQQLPPGTEVTPLQGMQQMGLAPDPVQAPVTDSQDSSSGATVGAANGQQDTSQAAVADAADPSQNPQVPTDSGQQNLQEETVPAQNTPDSAPVVPDAVSTPVSTPAQPVSFGEPAAAASSVNPDRASYASAEQQPTKPAVAKRKPATNRVRVQTIGGSSAAGVNKTQTPPPAPTTAPATAAPVQLLEGHLSQQPESSSTANPKPK